MMIFHSYVSLPEGKWEKPQHGDLFTKSIRTINILTSSCAWRILQAGNLRKRGNEQIMILGMVSQGMERLSFQKVGVFTCSL